jgi:hypothetical protein
VKRKQRSVGFFGDIKVSTFRFPCFRNYVRVCGDTDAVIECVELFTRHSMFLINSDLDKRSLIKGWSDKYKVHVSDVDIDKFKLRLAQLYVVSAQQQFEEFIRSFRKECFISWPEKEEGSLFEKTFNALPLSDHSAYSFEVDLLNYYGKIRNVFIHSGDKTKCDLVVRQLKKTISTKPEYAKYNAPSSFDEINFDDFILFTRVSKNVAEEMCVLGKPTDKEIVQNLEKQGSLKGMRKLCNNSERMKKSLMNMVQTEYSLDSSEAKGVVEILLKEILA